MVGLRLMVFDATCRWPRLPLSRAWRAGRWLYQRLGRLDLAFGATGWEEALGWLAEAGGAAPIAEVQFWSHGRWGLALLGGEVLDRQALRPEHRLYPRLRAVRERLAGERALWWLRTCQSFGASAGQGFASALVDFLGCRGAGHTHVIGFWQSGLHSLRPGQHPSWPEDEGVARGSAAEPLQARHSWPGAPNTITCLHGRVPAGF